jgi:hypothetical protein
LKSQEGKKEVEMSWWWKGQGMIGNIKKLKNKKGGYVS